MKNILYLLILICILVSCKTKLKTIELGAFDYKTSCVSNNNGILIVNTWGKGLTPNECELDALKKAVYDVTFKGIYDGNINCQQPPLLTDPKAKEEMQSFMTSFLNDEKGKYINYVSIHYNPRTQNTKMKEPKFNHVQNNALDYQVQVDRVGLAKIVNNIYTKK